MLQEETVKKLGKLIVIFAAILSCCLLFYIALSSESRKYEPVAGYDFVNRYGMKFIWIGPGAYKINREKYVKERYISRSESERTIVVQQGYWLSATEVTYEQYWNILGYRENITKDNCNMPVSNINWHDADDFCERLSSRTGLPYKLPSEVEWEFACHSGSIGASEEIDKQSWHKKNSGGLVHPVASKKPNKLGIYDLYGNLWEFCADDYRRSNEYYDEVQGQAPYFPPRRDSYYKHYRQRYQDFRDDQRNDYGEHFRQSPSIATIRGGCWNTPPAEFGVSLRDKGRGDIDCINENVGIRVMLSSSR